MGVLIRTALIWLLAVALPFQGAVAATMLACGPSHPGSPSHAMAAPHHHGDDADAAHGHHAPGSHDHGSHHGTVDRTDAERASASVVKSPGASTCSVCAACCTVSVLPAAALPFLPEAVSDSIVVFTASQPVVFLTGGPERPPRTVLA